MWNGNNSNMNDNNNNKNRNPDQNLREQAQSAGHGAQWQGGNNSPPYQALLSGGWSVRGFAQTRFWESPSEFADNILA